MLKCICNVPAFTAKYDSTFVVNNIVLPNTVAGCLEARRSVTFPKTKQRQYAQCLKLVSLAQNTRISIASVPCGAEFVDLVLTCSQ